MQVALHARRMQNLGLGLHTDMSPNVRDVVISSSRNVA